MSRSMRLSVLHLILFLDKTGALLVVERDTDVHAVHDLHEGVGHAADAHDTVGLVDEVLDDEDLVGDLGAADDGGERPLPLGRVEHLPSGRR